MSSIKELERMLRTYKLNGDYLEGAAVHMKLGNHFRLSGHFEAAMQQYESEIVMSSMGQGTSYRVMAEINIKIKKVEEAARCAMHYLDFAQKGEHFVEEHQALMLLGHSFLLRAEEVHEEVMCPRQSGIKHVETAKLWFEKAYNLLQEDKVKKQLNEKNDIFAMKVATCINLGATLELLGSSSEAIKWYEEAVEIGKKSTLTNHMYNCYSALANLHAKQMELEKALVCAEEAVNVFIFLKQTTEETEANLLQAKILCLWENAEEGILVLKRLRNNTIYNNKRGISKLALRGTTENNAIKFSILPQVFPYLYELDFACKSLQQFRSLVKYLPYLKVLRLDLRSIKPSNEDESVLTRISGSCYKLIREDKITPYGAIFISKNDATTKLGLNDLLELEQLTICATPDLFNNIITETTIIAGFNRVLKLKILTLIGEVPEKSHRTLLKKRSTRFHISLRRI